MEGIYSYLPIGILLILGTCAEGQQHIPYGTRTANRNRPNRLIPRQISSSPAHSSHPKIVNIEAQCFPDGMSVKIDFDLPFSGIVYSKGFFGVSNCRFVQGNPSGSTQLSFGVPAKDCGTKENKLAKSLSNVLHFQMDEDVQEIWDIARKVSCSYARPGDTHEKMVVFKPLSVGMLDVEHHPIKNEELDCWMDIQIGKYPNISPIKGQIPIGEELSILIYLRDDEKQYDVRVKDCWAFDMEHFEDSKTSKVQLTGYDGCPRKVKLIGPWEKTLDTKNSGATIIAYTNMTAFKFPESDNVHLTCNIEVCRGVCPQETCSGVPSQITGGQGQIRVTPATDSPSYTDTTPYPGQRYTGAPQPQRPGSAPAGQRPGSPYTPSSTPAGQRPGSAPGDQPGSPYTSQQPGSPPSAPRPASPYASPQTGSTPTGQRPGSPYTSQQPGYPPSAQRPGSPYTSQQPGSAPSAQRPGAPYTTQQPGSAPLGERPVSSPAGQRPGSAEVQTDRPPVCYEGSYDPRCKTYPGQNVTQEVPDFAGVCPPGSVNPECLQYPSKTDPSPDSGPDDISEGFAPPDESEDDIQAAGQVPTTTPGTGTSELRNTPAPVREAYTSPRAPICYPGQPDPRCPGSYPQKPSSGSGRPSYNTYQPETTTKKIPQVTYPQPQTTFPQGPNRIPSRGEGTSRPFVCYPGQVDPRCAKPQTLTTSPYDENEEMVDPGSYTPTEQPKTTVGEIRVPSLPSGTSGPFRCYPGTKDPRCPQSYTTMPNESEDEVANSYFTTTPKPYQPYPSTQRVPGNYPTTGSQYPGTTKQPVRYQPTPGAPAQYQPAPGAPAQYQPTTKQPFTYQPTTKQPFTYQPTTKQPFTYQPTTKQPYTYQPTTPRSYVSSTTRKVLCYPGQPDPRCPGSYPSKAPDYVPNQTGVLYDYPTSSTTRPNVPSTPSRTQQTQPQRVTGSTEGPLLCYPGSPHPRCQTTLAYESEEDAGNTYLTTPKSYDAPKSAYPTPSKPKSQYQTPSTANLPSRYQPQPTPTTPKSVRCYPGQIDPRCPESIQGPKTPGSEDVEVAHNEFEMGVEDGHYQPPVAGGKQTSIAPPPSLFEPPMTTRRPDGYGPNQNGYQQPQNGYKPDRYQPKPNGYSPRPVTYGPNENEQDVQPGGYQPKPNGYSPRPETSQPNVYSPRPDISQPKPNGYQYKPPGQTPKPVYGPNKNEQDVQPGGYKPKPNEYSPRPDTFQPKSNGKSPKPTVYAPNENEQDVQPGGYQPKPNGYSPRPDISQPKPNGYQYKTPGQTPKPVYGPNENEQDVQPGGYKPKPGEYSPRPDISQPKPNGYSPKPPAYEPNEKEQDVQPGGYKPQPNGYSPRPDISQPRPSGYQPKPNGYSPRPDISQPQPNGYSPRPDISQPQPNGYSPKPDISQPQPSGYRPKPDGYSPKPTAYVPDENEQDVQPGGYKPKPNGQQQRPQQNGYGPKPGQYEPRPNGQQPNQYVPEPSRYEPKPKDREPVKGYVYAPPTGKPFTYDTTQRPTNGNGSPQSGGSRTTPSPVVCYPGQVDPRCPKVCYEGSPDRRCTRKREVDQNQLICFQGSTDPRCPKFN